MEEKQQETLKRMEKKRDIENKVLENFRKVLEKFQEKCDDQMDKEKRKFDSNVFLRRDRDKAIQEIM
jgi:hypothetical protein